MKKITLVLTSILMVLSACFMITSCGDPALNSEEDNGVAPRPEIVGTWVHEETDATYPMTVKYVITASKFTYLTTVNGMTTGNRGTYSCDGDKLTVTVNESYNPFANGFVSLGENTLNEKYTITVKENDSNTLIINNMECVKQ